jgi:ribosome-binding protein aMBF1 (putative translation factor)
MTPPGPREAREDLGLSREELVTRLTELARRVSWRSVEERE